MKDPVPEKILAKKKRLQALTAKKQNPLGQNLDDSEEDDIDEPTFKMWESTGDSKDEDDSLGKKWRDWKGNNKRG
eukprot:7245420-Karenia_brevis.AAC.1